MEKRVSTVLSRAPAGLSAPLVRVEVHLGPGLPAFAMVGLPEAVVRESKERVRSALVTAGFDFPVRAHHGQSISRRFTEGRRPLRSADRGRHPGGERPTFREARWRAARVLRRARTERRASRDAEAAAGVDGRSAYPVRIDSARGECAGGELGRRSAGQDGGPSARGVRCIERQARTPHRAPSGRAR